MKAINGITARNGDRVFESIGVPMNGQHVRMFRLKCSTTNCGFEGDIANPKSHSLPGDVIRKKFEQKGWEVGKDARGDKCPRCVERETIERRQRRNPALKSLGHLAQIIEPPKQDTTPMEAPSSTPPTMTREHKRIINIKLHEVYINENEGYQTPWSDKNVAQHLGIPVSWVEEVREELFGPAQDNAEVREFLAKAKTVNENTAKILTDASAKLAEAKNVLAAIKTVEQTLGEVRRLLDTMNAAAARIERAVAP